jgi:hypothetical protein
VHFFRDGEDAEDDEDEEEEEEEEEDEGNEVIVHHVHDDTYQPIP